jgi:uncharacterized membrane protein
MNMKNISFVAQISLLIAFIAISLISYQYLPSTVTTHWGANGEANGTMSKETNLLFMSGIIFVIYIVLKAVVYTDPEKKNIQSFRDTYEWFIAFMLLFFNVINIFVLLWNFGYKIDIAYFLIPLFASLSVFLGSMLSKSKRNYSIGIRTPWTLSSDEVWDKTHALGGKLFLYAGLLSLIGILFPTFAMFFILLPLVGISLYLVLYSFVLYKSNIKK